MASLREVIPSYSEVGKLCSKVATALGPGMASSTVPVALWYDPEYKASDVDAEAGFYLEEPPPGANGINVHQLAETTVASTIHNGSYGRLGEAYNALMIWIASNGYQIAGPIREIYLHMSEPVRQDDESYVTEIQAPVTAQHR